MSVIAKDGIGGVAAKIEGFVAEFKALQAVSKLGTGTTEDEINDLVTQYEDRHGKDSFSNLGYDHMMEVSTYFQGDGLSEQAFQLTLE